MARFSLRKKGGTKPLSHCKTCKQTYDRQRYSGNPKREIAKTAKWRMENPERVKTAKLKRDFGLTLDDYKSMAKAQGNRCAICRQRETVRGKSGRIKDLCVDHDHKTGQVRGLLCSRCNRTLGLCDDNYQILKRGGEYLKKWKGGRK